MVDLAVVEEEGEVVASAGYVVQLLPELTDPPLAAMNARLARLGSLQDFVAERLKEGGLEPEHILQAILAEEEFTMLADSEVEFSCPCDRNRVLVAAAALGRDEIKKLLAEEEDLSISCDYCREPYTIGVADYRTILDNLSGS